MPSAGSVDARLHFSNAEVKNMEELASINEQLKELDKKKKTLVESVKNSMLKTNISSVHLDGNTFSITDSTRRTVTAKTKDQFIAALAAKGKQHLVITKIEPDVESIFAEVDAGLLDKTFVESYIQVTPVVTLRCN